MTNDLDLSWEEVSGTYDQRQRFRIYRLCECPTCSGRGRRTLTSGKEHRCVECRGEGRIRDLIATCETPEALGLSIFTLGQEGEFEDCPIGILDSQGEAGQKWIVKPWLPSPRNVTDAARLLNSRRRK